MFNLILNQTAPENTGHYEGVLTDGATTYKLGQAIYLDAQGKAKLCGGATNSNKIYGIVAEKEVDGKTVGAVNVLKIEKEMIFKCPITGTTANIGKAVKGYRLAINTSDYGSVAAAAATLGADYAGASVVESLGASKDGDLIEVRFI
jgi:hypothetical protein